MEDVDDIIDNWKKEIKKTKEENMFEAIKWDLIEQLKIIQGWESSFDGLIEEVKDKIKKFQPEKVEEKGK